MQLLEGKVAAKHIKQNLKEDIDLLKKKGLVPNLRVVIVGNSPASLAYVNMVRKSFNKEGVNADVLKLDESISEDQFISELEKLNNDNKVSGILIQLPLPKQINTSKIIKLINPNKDVDGFHPLNAGKLLIGEDTFIPCTPYGMIKMLEEYDIDIEGKNAVVLGRSNIVGKPISLLLMEKNATVTICHSRTKNIKEIASKADILVAAIGKHNFVDESMVKEGAIVLDVGIHVVDGKLKGDVDFENVKNKVSYITPVPGGVGTTTIAMLMYNTVKACKLINKTN
ncbi:bifunctional 5,10-methylenetetrahydrofolate dehydrogenase/5,10-methenyltetrahydrofolate cyclohydrolase [Helicovermis profundi]|uniref:Bifunctional protein FolD n=1 Tax=Helicovermis profundi TaxID=3065157 RepID=A0AAU9EFA9_9FIRM|nr:bifunctional methylenetetrahydrofolate dehydrogenase/methenyltetrahydrofolate cyclohydrolase FolD [Clostridia bacterium S502]